MPHLRRTLTGTLVLLAAAMGAAAQEVASSATRGAADGATMDASAATTPDTAALRKLALPLLARRWKVSPAQVVLELGAARSDWSPGPTAHAELLGTGARGQWVLRVWGSDGSNGSIRVRAGVRTRARVAARSLPRGHTLTTDDMAEAEEVQWGEPVEEEAQAVAGWVTRRVLKKGDALRPPAVAPPLAVRSGRPVSVVWRRDGVGLRVDGKAEGSAALGDQVLVRTESGKRLKGVVVAPDVVNVTTGGWER